MRVEEDFGDGFVRLKSSEAERRQAAQDIRSSEDIVVELLRNSRDAGAENIYLAMQREGDDRILVVIDDGNGVPAAMSETIFQPRVTSKLDSAHLDKWGIHGRGMALYSIKVNARSAEVRLSAPGRGTSMRVITDTMAVAEKTDQSTFPCFEENDGSYVMRGPKNILRTAAEFAFDCRRSVNVYCGSPTEIASTLYHNGLDRIPASRRLFDEVDAETTKLVDLPALSKDPLALSKCLADLGLELSTRSARRVMDGSIAPLPTLMERISEESFPRPSLREGEGKSPACESPTMRNEPRPAKVALSKEDLGEFSDAVAAAFSRLAEKYYLASLDPTIVQRGNAIHLRIDLERDDQ